MNSIIDRRNETIHPSNDKLIINVQRCMDYFKQFHELPNKYKQEYEIISRYDKLKKYFRETE